MRILIALIAIALLLAIMPAHGDLSVLDEYKAHNWRPFMAQAYNISGPGVVVSGLPISQDKAFLKSVQEVLDKYTYDRKYELNVFDCTNSSQITWYVLRQNGFDARILYSNEVATGRVGSGTQNFYGHVWVVVPKNKYTGGDYEDYITNKSGGWIPVETTENCLKHLGYAYCTAATGSWFKSNQGWLFNSSREYSLLTGDFYQLGSGKLDIVPK